MVLQDPTISGRHAKLSWDEGRVLVEDLGSANGTFVAGKRVERAHIRPGDEVRFGRADLSWSDSAMRPFLRAGRSDTTRGVSIPGRRFICGACGTRGVMPQGFQGGLLRCGACSERLLVGKPKVRSRSTVTVALVALAAAAVVGVWAWGGLAGSGELRQAARRLVEGIPSTEDGASSPQEASIRVHTVDDVVGAMDATSSVTRNAAVRIASQEEGPYRVEQVARLWSHVRSNWRYVNDPRGSEYFASAAESIENDYAGDCDDFAIVLVAMVTAIGGEARLVMMDGPQGGHAYAEACVHSSSDDVRDRLARHYRRHRDTKLGRQRIRSIHYRPSESCEVWLNLDWNAGVPGGPYEPESWAVAISPDGTTETLAPAGAPAPAASPTAVPTSALPPG